MIRHCIDALNCIESNFDLYFLWMFSWECLCPEFMMKASFPGVIPSPILDLAEILLKLGLSFHIWRSSSSYVYCQNWHRDSKLNFHHTVEICMWNEWKKDFWILFLSHTGAHHRLFIIWPMWYLSASMKDYPGTYCHVEVTYYILHYLNL